MRRHSRPGRRNWVVSGLTAAGLLASLTTGTAQAEDGQDPVTPDPLPVSFTGPDHYGLSLHAEGPEPGESSFEISLRGPGEPEPDDDGVTHPIHYGDFEVTIDATGLKGVAEVDLPCGAEGLVAVCDAGYLFAGEMGNERWGIGLRTGEESEAGDTGTIKVTGQGEGLTFTEHTVDVLVGGAEFEMRRLSEPEGFAAGDVFHARMGFRNVGGVAADGVVLRFSGSRGLTYPQEFSNCSYAVENEDNLTRLRHVALCTFEGSFAPGAAYRVATPVKVATAAFAFNDILDYHFTALDPSEAGNLRGEGTYKRGEGGKLELEPVQGGTYTDWATLDLATTNTYDRDLVGGRAQGEKGDSVTVNVALRNRGPGWMHTLRAGGGEPIGITVEIPEGATVTEAPEDCGPLNQDGEVSTRTYRCWTETPLLENEKRPFPFTFRIDEVVEGAKGLVSLPKWDNPYEGDPSNDDGWIVLNGTGDEETPGDDGASDGSDGSGGTDGSDDSSGDSSGGDSSAGGSGDDPAGAEESGTDRDGDTLALTGTGAMTLGGGALALLAAGGALLVLRRRRAVAELTDDVAV